MKARINLYLKSLLFITGLALSVISTSAQSIEMDWIELAGNKVIVHYNLQDPKVDRNYQVSLYTSRDNFTTPLTHVTGDVGPDVRPGFDHRIIWDITRELGEFKGDLSFEVKGRIFIPFVRLTDLNAGKVFKRGKNYPITWTSGNLSGQVNIELFNDKQERTLGENNLPNNGKFDFYIPASTKSASGYRLKFTNGKDRNDIQYSQPFTIKPKVPFLVKAAAVVVVVGGVAVLVSGHGSTPTPTPEDEDLPLWPGLPN
jgi:Ser-Thr-rich glycosyl-phosphatidyl-inositol-anchored membrane family